MYSYNFHHKKSDGNIWNRFSANLYRTSSISNKVIHHTWCSVNSRFIRRIVRNKVIHHSQCSVNDRFIKWIIIRKNIGAVSIIGSSKPKLASTLAATFSSVAWVLFLYWACNWTRSFLLVGIFHFYFVSRISRQFCDLAQSKYFLDFGFSWIQMNLSRLTAILIELIQHSPVPVTSFPLDATPSILMFPYLAC